jgi:hypothetical protein
MRILRGEKTSSILNMRLALLDEVVAGGLDRPARALSLARTRTQNQNPISAAASHEHVTGA